MNSKKIKNAELNPADPLAVIPEVKEEAESEGYRLRWIKKDPSGVQFRAKQAAGAIPVDDYPEYHDLKLHKIPVEIASKHEKRVQQEADQLMGRIFESYEAQHQSATGRKPKITVSMRRDREIRAGDCAFQKDRSKKRKYFVMGK
ncbi:MAG: hypothetical protein J7M18_08800 [Candidatus Eremiobacteraeota bacterium]|nr:hypothetical protein [Candidatus Eremiobacteraeota bacterium]